MNVSKAPINKLISQTTRHFKIPNFQRPFSWHKSNAAILLEDLQALVDDPDREHYFGCVVYETIDDNYIIIDGQQRITTILLMIVAIYHLIKDSPDQDDDQHFPARRIKEQYLYNQYGGQERLKLRGTTDDNQIFQQIYQQSINPNWRNSNLYRVYSFFYDHFKKRDNLADYIRALDRLMIVDISLDKGRDNPQKIFESINAKGEPLTEADKIRNFALMSAQPADRDRIFSQYWQPIDQELVDTKINKNFIADFFFSFLVSYDHRPQTKKAVYPQFKKFFLAKINDKNQTMDDFYQAVIAGLNSYLLLKFVRHRDDNHQAFKPEAFRINYLKNESTYPFLMNVLKHHRQQLITKHDVKIIFNITEGYLARRFIAGLETRVIAPVYYSLDKDIINDLKDRSYLDVYARKLLQATGDKIYPQAADLRLKINHSQLGLGKNHIQYFILSSYDDKTQAKESNLLSQIKTNIGNYMIHHIMPSNIDHNQAWQTELGPNWENIHRQYVNTLPNLTLIDCNHQLPDVDFANKLNHRQGFRASRLLLNKDSVAIYQNWSEKTLEQRAQWWLDQIDELWPVPQTDLPDISPVDSIIKPVHILKEIEKNLTGTKPLSVTFRNHTRAMVSGWNEVLSHLLDEIYDLLGDHSIKKILSDDKLVKLIGRHEEDFNHSVPIANSDYFFSTNSSTENKITTLKRIFTLLDINSDDVVVEIVSD